MDDEVKGQVVKNMVTQGPFAFCSLQHGVPTTIFSENLRPHDWLYMLESMFQAAGLTLPPSIATKLHKEAQALHHNR